jgi:hypothetical protein
MQAGQELLNPQSKKTPRKLFKDLALAQNLDDCPKAGKMPVRQNIIPMISE